MNIRTWAAVGAATTLLLAGCGGSGGGGTPAIGWWPTPAPAEPTEPVTPPSANAQLRVLSSSPDYVSGGDARIEVSAPAELRQDLELWLNGERVEAPLAPSAAGYEGVVAGLREGSNTLELRQRPGEGAEEGRVLHSLSLTNYPITGPMFSGPQQVPFVCTTIQSAVNRQPLVDSPTQPGYEVRENGVVVGYSRNCSIETFVSYFYGSTAGGNLKPLVADAPRPEDMAQLTLDDGRTVDYVVRREIGSINRFLYSIAMLAPMPSADNAQQSDTSLWNRKLLYYFQGGVAIGHSQGTVHSRSMDVNVLRKGWAIVHSSGNNTGTHYNMNLAGETALMTKERFIERYGVPLHTVGLGASGGAIQQYLFAQNHPGLLDGLLPVQSYPDMVTQTIHVGDCELLEHYMDVTDKANPKWRTTKNRTWLVGFNAEDSVPDALAPLKQALGYSTAPGSTECIESWRGLSPLTLNPHYGEAPNAQFYMPQSDIAAIRWTHYDDLRNVYGVDDRGAARVTWDNVGVQYGLQALKDGQITPAEFLDLNWKIGGWKHPSDMVQEGFPFFGTTNSEINRAMTEPGYFDPWSRRNMRLGDEDNPAPRTEGNVAAMNAAYSSGHVFGGTLNVPAIDHREYLERELDMHNAHQSFAVRKRVQQKMGHSDNMVIWFTEPQNSTIRANQSILALDVMDEWLSNIRANPGLGIAGNKPVAAVDACFDAQGNRLEGGSAVWAGILDGQAAGSCTQRFPLYTTSRIVAGAPIEGGIYQCARKPVDTAVADGTYGTWKPAAQDIARLKRIFPQGVCDYGQPDRGKPAPATAS